MGIQKKASVERSSEASNWVGGAVIAARKGSANQATTGHRTVNGGKVKPSTYQTRAAGERGKKS